MLLELLLERLKAALRVKGNWAVYAAYDPAPFAKREESFLTVGITALETEQAFSDETYWYFPFSAAAQVRLLTTPETDAQVLYDRYWQTVVSGMLSAGCTVQKIRTGAPTEWKQFRKIALEGSFTLSGVFQIAKEEVLGTMNGTFQVVSPREFPVRLGNLTFYAAGWKLSGTRQYAQQGGVQGAAYVTNTSCRARQLVLDGKFCFADSPAEVVLALDSAIRERTLFAFDLRDLRFFGTSLAAYTISETAAQGVLPCQLTLIAPNALSRVTAETEGGST